MRSDPALTPATAVARVLVDEIVRGGVREAVLAPGSRSAPLAFALHAADAAGMLRLHVRIDERTAGFLALGLAKASGAPVVVVTTSGTAAANLHPAILEASESGIPLVVLTADRPPELRATGANQTVDQIGLYGAAVRAFHEVGAPDGLDATTLNRYVRGLASRTLSTARGLVTRDPGPVHLNLAFRDPLVPSPTPRDHAQVALDLPPELSGRPGDGPWTDVQPTTTVQPYVDETWPDRTLVVVGDAPPAWGQQVVRLAEARGWPILSEPSGNARTGPNALTHGHLLLDPGEHPDLRPERVLVVGRPTLDRRVARLLGDPRLEVVVVAPNARWADSARTASLVLPMVPEPGEHRPYGRDWLDAWRSADQRLVAARPAEPWGGPAVAAALHAGLPPGSLLVAGSSLPIRDLRATAPREGVTVLANRGAAGIDGTLSTAIGAALAWQSAGGGPAAALIGDLTFLHDATGLLAGPQEPRPRLAVVVVNNDGGGLFALLEQGAPAYAASFDRVFGTPVGADLAALCGASATPYSRVSSTDELVAAVNDPRESLHVVEARVAVPSAG